MDYIIDKQLKGFTLTNIVRLNIKVSFKDSCASESFVTLLELTDSSEDLSYTFSNGDGLYQVEITDPYTPVTETHLFYHYHELLHLTIGSIKHVLCNCGCESCDDCNEDTCLEETMYNSLFVKMLTYLIFTSTLNPNLFFLTQDAINCTLTDMMKCYINKEMIWGKKPGNPSDTKYMLGYLFMLCYVTFYNMYPDASEEVDTFFEIVEIKKCLRKIGLEYQNIETLAGKV